MKDWIEFDTVPYNVECEPAGGDGLKSRREAKAMINQLRRLFGDEPLGARLCIKSCPHDFGEYLEIRCVFNDEVDDAVHYAYCIDDAFPAEWDAEAKAELAAYREAVTT